jgi:hypothetical protein
MFLGPLQRKLFATQIPVARAKMTPSDAVIYECRRNCFRQRGRQL